MNVDEAITCHVAWRLKLTRYIAHPDSSINAATISTDDQCDLGRWLKGEGAKFASLPEFSILKKEHAHFHSAAGSIVTRADKGEKVSEDVALGSKSEFAKASNSVVSALMNIKMKIGQK
jgi:methyl-accepting chemotaxis protein